MASTLLDGVTSTGAGAVKQARLDIAKFGVTIAYATAAPDSATIKLQGSTDGTTWVDLGETQDVSATSVGFAVDGMSFQFVRGNMTAYSAGSNSGVTMKCTGTLE
jgi:hypothetical protein